MNNVKQKGYVYCIVDYPTQECIFVDFKPTKKQLEDIANEKWGYGESEDDPRSEYDNDVLKIEVFTK